MGRGCLRELVGSRCLEVETSKRGLLEGQRSGDARSRAGHQVTNLDKTPAFGFMMVAAAPRLSAPVSTCCLKWAPGSINSLKWPPPHHLRSGGESNLRKEGPESLWLEEWAGHVPVALWPASQFVLMSSLATGASLGQLYCLGFLPQGPLGITGDPVPHQQVFEHLLCWVVVV